MKTIHTPLPWQIGTVCPELIISASHPKKPAIAEVFRHDWDQSDPWITRDMQTANTALIVRAVNSHAALVGALNELIAKWDAQQERGVAMMRKDWLEARAIIARAQEGQP